MTVCAATFAARERAGFRDGDVPRAMISVIVKPASCSATARKVARLPASTMATVGFLVIIIVIVLPVIGFRLNGAAYLILLSWRNWQERSQQGRSQRKPAFCLRASVTRVRCLASRPTRWKSLGVCERAATSYGILAPSLG